MTIIRKQNKNHLCFVLAHSFLFFTCISAAFPCCHFCLLLQIIAETFFFLLALRGHGIRLVWKNSAWFYSYCLLLVKRGTKQTPVASVLVRNKLSLWREVHMVLPLEDDLLIKTTPSLSEFLSKHTIHYRCFRSSLSSRAFLMMKYSTVLAILIH